MLPAKKKKVITAEYYEEFYKEAGGIENIVPYFDDAEPCGFFAIAGGKYAQILKRHSDGLFYVLVFNTVYFKETRLKDMVVKEIKFILARKRRKKSR